MASILITEGLKNCPDFKGLTKSDIEALGQICQVVEYPKGHDVFAIDQQEKYIFVVVFGKLALRLRHTGRIEHFKNGDLFGEIALFSKQGRLGAIHCIERSELLAIDIISIQNSGVLPDELRLKLFSIFGQKMASYFYKDDKVSLSNITNKGEKSTIEFKTSFAEKSQIQDTIISFMNWNGGLILVGVSDKGEILGLKKGRAEIDQFATSLLNDLKNRYKKVAATYVDYSIEEMDRKTILCIQVKPSEMPVILNKSTGTTSEGLLVRTGSQNTYLKDPAEIVEYTRRRLQIQNS